MSDKSNRQSPAVAEVVREMRTECNMDAAMVSGGKVSNWADTLESAQPGTSGDACKRCEIVKRMEEEIYDLRDDIRSGVVRRIRKMAYGWREGNSPTATAIADQILGVTDKVQSQPGTIEPPQTTCAKCRKEITVGGYDCWSYCADCAADGKQTDPQPTEDAEQLAREMESWGHAAWAKSVRSLGKATVPGEVWACIMNGLGQVLEVYSTKEAAEDRCANSVRGAGLHVKRYPLHGAPAPKGECEKTETHEQQLKAAAEVASRLRRERDEAKREAKLWERRLIEATQTIGQLESTLRKWEDGSMFHDCCDHDRPNALVARAEYDQMREQRNEHYDRAEKAEAECERLREASEPECTCDSLGEGVCMRHASEQYEALLNELDTMEDQRDEYRAKLYALDDRPQWSGPDDDRRAEWRGLRFTIRRNSRGCLAWTVTDKETDHTFGGGGNLVNMRWVERLCEGAARDYLEKGDEDVHDRSVHGDTVGIRDIPPSEVTALLEMARSTNIDSARAECLCKAIEAQQRQIDKLGKP